MSDLLEALAERERRRAMPDAPVTVVVIGFVAAFFATLFLVPVTLKQAAHVASGLASRNELILYFATVLGIALVAATVVWGVIFFAFVRRARPRWAVGLLGGLAVMMVLVSLGGNAISGGVVYRQEQESIAKAEIRRVIADFQKDGVDADFSNTRPKARGQAGEVERLVKETVADAARVASRHNREFDALKLGDLAPRDVARADLTALQAKLRKATSLVVAYRNEIDEVLKRARTRVEASKLDSVNRRTYLRGFESGFVERQQVLDRSLDLQLDLIDQTSEQIAFLQRRRGAWMVRGDNYVFSSMADVNEFNRLGMAIRRTAQQFNSLQANESRRLDNLSETVFR